MAEVWGLVLAGGRSSRMGQCKARLPYRGKQWIDVMVGTLADVLGDSSKVLVSGKFEEYRCVEDEFLGRGPLEGLRRVVELIPEGDVLIVVPVDMPLLIPENLQLLLKNLLSREVDFVKFSHSELPCALRISLGLKERLKSMGEKSMPRHQRSFKNLFGQLHGWIEECLDTKVLINVNTPEEWQEILK